MYIIKLQLFPPDNTFDYATHLLGLDALSIDKDYGCVTISPKRGLYVIRVSDSIDIDRIRALPEVMEVYGDVPVAAIEKRKTNLED